jgi:hypothetical protein
MKNRFLVLWAVIATIVAIASLTIRTSGTQHHRLYGVPSLKAQDAVLNVLKPYGLSVKTSEYKAGSRYITLSDDVTIIGYLDDDPEQSELSGNAFVIPVDNPFMEASSISQKLLLNGYTQSNIKKGYPGYKEAWVVHSTAFSDWIILFVPRHSSP